MRWTWVVLLLATAGCRHTTAPGSDVTMTTSVNRSTFRAGDTVTVTVVIANDGRDARAVPSKDCPSPFVVTTAAGIVVGPDVGARGCLLDLPSVMLGPGERLEFSAQWDGSAQRTNPDAPALLAPGTYLLRGQLAGSAPQPPSEPVTIQIVP